MFPWTAEEEALSTAMLDYFGNFAWSGNPNVGGATQRRPRGAARTTRVTWPAFTDAGLQSIALIAPEVVVETGFRQDACDFFDVLSYDPIRKGPSYQRFDPRPLFGRAAGRLM